jgi:putative heme-binding domain-containing protein
VVTIVTQSGMPPFGFLGAQNISAVVGYLRTLQGVPPSGGAPAAAGDQRGNGRGRGASSGGGAAARAANTPVTGDVANGKALFFGKAQCSNCHAVAGEGGVLGPDMSNYGASHAPGAVEESILHPGAAPTVPARRGGFGGGAAASRPVEIKTKAGKTITGMVRGEDNLHLAVQTESRYYFLDRSSLASVTYLKTSLMPTDYGTRLTPAELNDIVSYIVVTGRAAPVEPQTAAPVGRRRGGGF